MDELDVIAWKIWYGDGSGVSSKDVAWEEAPDQDVQIVMLYYRRLDGMGRHCRRVMSGADYYWKDGEEFDETNDWGEVRGSVKYGKWTDEANYNRLREITLHDYEI